MHFKPSTLIIFSGTVWLAIGVFLLSKGLHLIIDGSHLATSSLLIDKLTPFVGGREQSALALIAFGLLLGFMKGRLVLIKTVRRVTTRIMSLPAPVKFTQIYAWNYYLLIGLMIMLGVSMRWLPISSDVRGVVDVVIGSALMNGGLIYFRFLTNLRKETKPS